MVGIGALSHKMIRELDSTSCQTIRTKRMMNSKRNGQEFHTIIIKGTLQTPNNEMLLFERHHAIISMLFESTNNEILS